MGSFNNVPSGMKGKLKPSLDAITTQNLMSLCEAVPQMRASVAFAEDRRGKLRNIAPLAFVSFHHCMATLNAAEHSPSTFWEEVISGGGEPNSPAMALRRALVLHSPTMSRRHVQMHMMFTAIRAWNAWCAGETMDHAKLILPESGKKVNAPLFYEAKKNED